MSPATPLAFVKMHGAGNDYVFIDGLRDPFDPLDGPALARAWSDRRRGIGADGLIALTPAQQPAHAVGRMQMWNADGSRGAFCGNGLRCLAVLARTAGHAGTDRFVLESDAGRHPVEVIRDPQLRPVGARITVGAVTVATSARTLAVAGARLEVFLGAAGNPHAVVVPSDPDPSRWPVERLGAALQQHPEFPDGVNVSFAAPDGPARLRQRTFERGSGETLACGSGATVAAITALRLGLVAGPRIAVAMPGGELVVEVGDRPDAGPILEGPVVEVFRGTAVPRVEPR